MKKINILLTAVAATFALFSCNKGSGDQIDNVPTGQQFSQAQTIYMENGQYITTNADGHYLGYLSEALKSSSDYVYTSGKYTFKNGVYTLEGLGTLTIDAQSHTVTLIPEDGEEEDAIEFEVIEVTKPDPENGNEIQANHTWKATSVDISYKGANFHFDNVDLNGVEKWIQEDVLKRKADEWSPVFEEGMAMEHIFISNGFIAITFKNEKMFVSHIDLSKGGEFDIEDLTGEQSELLDGKASLAFINGKAYLSVKGSYDKQQASLTIVLTLA